MSKQKKIKLLFVGAFPPPHRKVYGGNVIDCRALLDSKLPLIMDLVLIDSTQISNPPPAFGIRLLLAIRRFFIFILKFEISRPDVLLLFTSGGASLVEKGMMAWYGRLRGVGSLIFPRSGKILDTSRDSYWKMQSIRFFFSGATKILCQGPAWKKFAIENLYFKDVDTPVISSWTASKDLLSIGQKRLIKSSKEQINFLFLGWVEDHKGILELVDACNILSKTNKFILNIVGDGSVSSECKILVSRYGLEESIFFHGWKSGEGLLELFESSDVFVLPSWSEGLPNSMIEAMAAKLAVIITKVGAIPDFLIHEANAILIPPRDIQALTIAMKRTLDDSSLREKIANAGHALAMEEWGIDKAVESIVCAACSAQKKATLLTSKIS